MRKINGRNCFAFELNILVVRKIHAQLSFNKHFEYFRILKTSDTDVNTKFIYIHFTAIVIKMFSSYLIKQNSRASINVSSN